MPQTTKILYLITLSELGGAQKYVFDLAVNLKRQEKIQTLVAYGGRPYDSLARQLQINHIENYYLKYLQRPINFYYDFLALIQLYKLIKKIQPDIVHLNSSKAGVLGALAAQLAGKSKIIYTVHGLVLNEPMNKIKKNIYWLAEWLAARLKDHFICVSNFDKQALLKYKLAKADKITVIPNGIQADKLHIWPRQLSRTKLTAILQHKINDFKFNLNDKNYCLIGAIANFYPSKGLAYLIQAIYLLKNKYPKLKVKLIIIGDGPGRRQLSDLIQTYQLAKDIFLPGILEKATRYLKAFDIFVLASIKEGLSYTLIEALTAQLPIIATRVGGNPEIIKNESNGLLVPPASAPALAQAIKKIASQENLANQFKQNNAQVAKRFNLTTMLEATKKVYLKIS